MAIKAHKANLIIDRMIKARKVSNPEEDWTRDVPAIWQERILGSRVTVAAESDRGRGAPVLDLYGKKVTHGGMLIEERVMSVKSTAGKRATGRTCIFTTGTGKHVKAIIDRLMDPEISIPVLFCHRNTVDGQWVQTIFDAGKIARGIMSRDGEGSYYGPAQKSEGKYGIPMVVAVREQFQGGKMHYYPQIRFNMNPLVTPVGQKIFRAPGKTGYGLITPWTKVNEPTLAWLD